MSKSPGEIIFAVITTCILGYTGLAVGIWLLIDEKNKETKR